MNKIAAYEMILENHPLWIEKVAGAKRLQRFLSKRNWDSASPGQKDAALREWWNQIRRADRYPGGATKYLKDATGQPMDKIQRATNLMLDEGSPALMKMITRKNKAGPLPMD